MAPPTVFEAERLYGAARAFAASEGFLFDARPEVVVLSAPPTPLHLPGLPHISAPAGTARFKAPSGDARSSDANARGNASRWDAPQQLYTFNPSLAIAPRGLCPRCAFAIALRVDALHQCSSATTPYADEELLGTIDWFQSTAIAILDAKLELLGWTWMLNSPPYQIASAAADPALARAARCLSPGVADHDFLPPWAKQTYDARLLAVDGELLVTYACAACVFSISPLRLTAEPTPDGGLTQLRAWTTDRLTYQHAPWLAGRNQALFVYSPAAADASTGSAVARARWRSRANGRGERASRPRLMVQPRLGVVGYLGLPRFVSRGVKRCATRPGGPTRVPPTPGNCRGEWDRHFACATWPDNSTVTEHALSGVRPPLAELRNDSRAHIRAMLRARGTFGGLSLTSNLVRVRGRRGDGDGDGDGCDVYLGVGHLHRGEGERNRRLYRRAASGPPPWAGTAAGVRRKQPFKFGFRYTHFWYALEARPPFSVISASAEFCLASPQDSKDCESVQFVSGLLVRGDDLVLAYGVNDCEARLSAIPLSRVRSMLRPLAPRGQRCGVGA